jgi:predicted NBD/HSP70 family sugar kinase/biotin operon repressor
VKRSTSGADLPALRTHNTMLVLELLRVAGDGGISRLELAERTGLTPQAVSKITARLREDGLVAEAGRRASTGGKPRTVLRLVRAARSAVGLHLDRDRLTAVLTDLTGETVAVRTVPFDFGANAERVLDAVVTEVRELLREAGEHGLSSLTQPPARTGHASGWGAGPTADSLGHPAAGHAPAFAAGPERDSAGLSSVPTPAPGHGTPYGPVLGVGVACPGPLDHRTGVLGRVTGLPQWDGYPLRDHLAARFGLPVVLDKDTNAAALGLALARGVPRTRGAAESAPRGSLGHANGVAGARAADRGQGARACAPASSAGLVHSAPAATVPARAANARAVPAAAATQSGQTDKQGESFAYLHLGTGLGAGLVLGGGLYRGSRTGAGEFGHQVIQLDGPPCLCGNRGCIEALCLAAVACGDYAEAARVLGTGAANLVGLLDIDRVLLGGRVAVAHAEVFARGVEAMLAGAETAVCAKAVWATGAAADEGRGEAGTVPSAVSDAGVVLATGDGRTVSVAVVGDAELTVAHGAAHLVLAPLFGHAEAAEPVIAPLDQPEIR